MSQDRIIQETNIPEIPLYTVKNGAEFDKEITPLIEKCREIVERIQSGATKDVNGKWLRNTPVDKEDKDELARIKEIFKKKYARGQKNILKRSTRNDRSIGHGKDNNVYDLPTRKGGEATVVYKESSIDAKPENVLYLRKKYTLLKNYLGNLIPQSRFVYGETNVPTEINKGMQKVDVPKKNVLTLQRKVQGTNLQKMPREEKNDSNFLGKLKIAHQKYVLLKMFVQAISREMGLPENTFDTKLDLGPLSDMDTLDTQDPVCIKRNMTSPNIMWDGKDVYFIDLDAGVWDENKEKLFEYMMNPEIVTRWYEMQGNMGLLDS